MDHIKAQAETLQETVICASEGQISKRGQSSVTWTGFCLLCNVVLHADDESRVAVHHTQTAGDNLLVEKEPSAITVY